MISILQSLVAFVLLVFSTKTTEGLSVEAAVVPAISKPNYDLLRAHNLDRIERRSLSVGDCYIRNSVMFRLKSCHLVRENPRLLHGISHDFLSSTSYWKTDYRERDATQRIYKKRRKRSSAFNPCNLQPFPVQSTIFYAVDSITGQTLELVQDPITGLFQTFFTFNCKQHYGSQSCSSQDLDFFASCFVGSGYQVQVRQVQIPTHCAITVV